MHKYIEFEKHLYCIDNVKEIYQSGCSVCINYFGEERSTIQNFRNATVAEEFYNKISNLLLTSKGE